MANLTLILERVASRDSIGAARESLASGRLTDLGEWRLAPRARWIRGAAVIGSEPTRGCGSRHIVVSGAMVHRVLVS